MLVSGCITLIAHRAICSRQVDEWVHFHRSRTRSSDSMPGLCLRVGSFARARAYINQAHRSPHLRKGDDSEVSSTEVCGQRQKVVASFFGRVRKPPSTSKKSPLWARGDRNFRLTCSLVASSAVLAGLNSPDASLLLVALEDFSTFDGCAVIPTIQRKR